MAASASMGAIAAGTRVAKRHGFDFFALDDHQRRYVIGVFLVESQVVGRRGLAALARYEDAAGFQALQAWHVLLGPAGVDGLAGIVAVVAGTRDDVGHEAAGIAGVAFGHAAGGGVDGVGQAYPAVEVIPAQRLGRGVAGLVMRGAGQVELAEHGAFVARRLEQPGRRDFVGRDLGIGQVVRPDGLVQAGAQRIAPGHDGGAAGRAHRHAPGVAESQAGIGHGGDVGQLGRRCAAIAEGLHLVYAHVVHDDQQNIGRVRRVGSLSLVIAGGAAATGQPGRGEDGCCCQPFSVLIHWFSPEARASEPGH